MAFAHDVFISYAHVDDLPLDPARPGQSVGWVTTLVQHLENFLGQEIGRAEGFTVWRDKYNLRGNNSLTPEIKAELERTAGARDALAAEIDRAVLATFEQVARGRKGIAVAEARDGMCMICHVRLRPQVFNEVRRNDAIIQCDSCRRILYFAGESSVAAPQP